MTVDETYKLIQYVCNKSQNGGYISPSDFHRVINAACHEYTDYLLGQTQSYQYGRSQARASYGNNQTIRQKLTPLITAPQSISVDGTGLALYPTDFIQADAMYTTDNKRIRYCPQDRFDAFYNSAIDPVATNPFFLVEATGFRVYPITLGSIKLSYVKKHPAIVWNSTLDGNGRPVYTSSGSAHPLWSDADMMQVIARALRMVGVNLQDNQVNQYALEVKNQGQ
jgi:hypothetical protein